MGPLEDITRREVLVTGGRILGGALLGTLLGQFSFLSEANAMPTPTNHFSPRNDKRALRPHTDYIILHTAIIENVDVLITGDKDFAAVDINHPDILTPTEFLSKY